MLVATGYRFYSTVFERITLPVPGEQWVVPKDATVSGEIDHKGHTVTFKERGDDVLFRGQKIPWFASEIRI